MSNRWVREAKRKNASAPEEEEPQELLRLVRPLGQGEAFARWTKAARRLDLPHGICIEGAPGSGKTTMVQWLTAALLCPSDIDDSEPCGMCRTCTRIANNLHPDVQVLERAREEGDQKSGDVKRSFYRLTVDQVRNAEEQLQRHAIEGRARVCCIAEADHLADEGQNALLKTLEEPGDATFLLLEASRPEQLLPTVRSRIQRLRVLPLSDEALRKELHRRIPEESSRFDGIVGLARGSLGQALRAATEQAVQLHDLVRAWLGEAHNLRPIATARQALEGASERRLELQQARLFLWLLRSELRRHRDTLVEAADASYPASSLEPWTTWLERTLQAERDLDLMIPPEQALVACLVELSR
ncbi:MAG: AAA family ATPase [Planctomycetota bacterium]